MTAVVHVMEDQEVGAGMTAGFVAGRGSAHWGQADSGADDAGAHGPAICAALREKIGDDRYDMWFDGKTVLTLAGNTLVVEAANAFLAKWIREKHFGDLQAVCAAVLGRAMEIAVRVGERPAVPRNMGPDIGTESMPRVATAPVNRASAMPVFNPRYSFEEFVIGPSNQMAYHAAMRVADNAGQQFNPLFLHGHCGLGKTHLLQAICLRFTKTHPTLKCLYLTGEQFTNEFLEAIKAHKTDAFRRRIRSADLLVLDDVHFLANKKATQEEFLHTFNQVDASGKQLVLASDCAPKQIHSLSEQLSSRFVSGMVLRVDSPDLPTRLEILRRRVARNQWNVSDAVLMHIAQTSASSVRELEGLLLQVIAGIRLINTGAGGAEAGAVLASIRERTAMRGPVAMERILAAVAEHFAIAEAAILGSGREKTVCHARAIAIYLARQHTGMSFPEIGRAMGNKNHSTAIAACQRVESLISTGQLICWNTPGGPRHQTASDVLHELEAAMRKVR